ncbi:GSCOCG00008678001-RA-CDS [Cotesia congregata]|nr:GSCOCG00008678001-RA-CDS [Cotesia congregata]
MSSFIYEGKLPITGINVIPIEDTEDMKNVFEISGPMIESIVVLCAHKEERSHWIELLTQDQSSNLLKSSTMSNVSYTNSPYSRLSRFYAKLVRKKIIHPELVKKLLYLQYSYKPDLSAVKMRKCKVWYTIYPTQSDEYFTDDSEKFFEKSPVQKEKPRALLKSSVMLDVRYTLKPSNVSDLKNNLSFSGSSASVGNYETKRRNYKQSKVDICQSLPSTFPSHKAESSLSYHHNSDNDKELKYLNLSSKTWKSIEATRQIDCASPEFIYVNHLSSQLTGVSENSLDTNAISCNLLPITSVYSSDSGMADSYHMPSTELTSSYKYYSNKSNRYVDKVQISCHESENDEHNFEHQCICSSPFGSTPRRSEQSGESSESVDDSIIVYTTLTSNENANNCIASINLESKINKEASKNDKNNIGSCKNLDDCNKRYTVPIRLESKNIYEKVKRSAVQRPKVIHVDVKESEKPVFTSGLYAHWWLKKAIPISENTNQGKLPWHGSMLCETNHQSIGKLQKPLPESCSSLKTKTPWGLASLRPAPPIYLKAFNKSDNIELSRSPRAASERQFEDDAIILKIIEGYCVTVNARLTVHPDNEPSNKICDSVSVVNSRIGISDSCDDRSLSQTVETLKNQVETLQNQVSQLTKLLDEEKQSRLLLTIAMKRIGAMDNFVSL